MKKKLFTSGILLLSVVLLFSCGDPNDQFDMRSPQAAVAVDSFQVDRGSTVELKAILTDESGLLSCNLDYSSWKVSEEMNLAEKGYPRSYEFITQVEIPEDALLSWEEDFQKNDGTIFRITQSWHKLSLTFYDAVKNKNVVYFYIKVNP